jgi:hypothetical protein
VHALGQYQEVKSGQLLAYAGVKIISAEGPLGSCAGFFRAFFPLLATATAITRPFILGNFIAVLEKMHKKSISGVSLNGQTYFIIEAVEKIPIYCKSKKIFQKSSIF